MGMRVTSGPDATIVVVISALVSLVIAILLWALVLPEKKRPKLGKFFVFLADIFNFKSLLIEKILKFTYVFLTFFAIVFGFCMLFIVSYGESMVLYGVLVIILGPIAIRLVYELSLLGIILVKNVIEINNKIKLEQEIKNPDKDIEEESISEAQV